MNIKLETASKHQECKLGLGFVGKTGFEYSSTEVFELCDKKQQSSSTLTENS